MIRETAEQKRVKCLREADSIQDALKDSLIYGEGAIQIPKSPWRPVRELKAYHRDTIFAITGSRKYPFPRVLFRHNLIEYNAATKKERVIPEYWGCDDQRKVKILKWMPIPHDELLGD